MSTTTLFHSFMPRKTFFTQQPAAGLPCPASCKGISQKILCRWHVQLKTQRSGSRRSSWYWWCQQVLEQTGNKPHWCPCVVTFQSLVCEQHECSQGSYPARQIQSMYLPTTSWGTKLSSTGEVVPPFCPTATVKTIVVVCTQAGSKIPAQFPTGQPKVTRVCSFDFHWLHSPLSFPIMIVLVAPLLALMEESMTKVKFPCAVSDHHKATDRPSSVPKSIQSGIPFFTIPTRGKGHQ